MSEVSKSSAGKRVLIDVGHPAHVHLFKNLAKYYISQQRQVLFTVRSKEREIELLEDCGFEYQVISYNRKGLIKKALNLPATNIRLLNITRKFKPNIILSHGSFYAAQVGWLLGIPVITLEDTGNWEQTILYKHFTDVILSPSHLALRFSKKQIFYDGFHELSYIDYRHKKPGQPCATSNNKVRILLRFVSSQASHDNANQIISNELKAKLVELLRPYGDVLISSEKKLPENLSVYNLNTNPSCFHNYLSDSSLIISEGSTTAIEGCLLGIPTIYLGGNTLGIINYLTNKGLLITETEIAQIKNNISKLLGNEYREELNKKRDDLIQKSIDLNKLLIWMIDQYPDSYNILKKSADYMNNFLLK